ncbi:MFS transporter [Leuconostoc mesenteroides]|uniref:MFS transporter n=1 Tax=Leuconostoc mesenteroides TaxID=1245 RepID=UPI002245C0AF|nr:MFS transporter [Leuconostoc mesenteroides]MCX2665468.1 MFS transporter [Leuconostoc mesenteroides subsp. mesenteroides]
MDKKRHLLFIIGTAWMIDALDVALLSFIMPLIKNEWDVGSTELGLAAAVTSIGMFVGSIVCGKLADKYGRKNIIIGTLLIFSLGNLALIFAPNILWFMVIRFIIGIGLGGELPVAATIIADNYTGTKRSQMLLLADSFWAYGWILASLISFLIIPRFGWRAAVALAALFAFYALALRKHLPNEPINKKSHEGTFKELLSSKHRSRLIVLSIMWFIVMLTYYGIFLWLPTVLTMRGFSIVNSLGYTLIMSIAQLPGYYLAAYLMNKMSRKKILAIYLLGTLISSFVFGFGTNIALILVAGAFMSFFDLGAWGTLISLTPAQFPEKIRGTAMGTAQAVGRVGATVGPFLVGWLFDFKLGISVIFSVFAVLLIIAIVVLLIGVKDNLEDEY